MMSSFAGRLLVAASLSIAGCHPVAGVDEEKADDGTCQQTYEFGNYGCASIVVLVQGPPRPWPASYLWDVRAVPVREGTGAGLALAPRPDTGVVPLGIIRYHRPAAGFEDTASVWVSARMLDDPRPAQTGVPLQTYAADSVLHVARFAAVGSRPPTDTVRLMLRRP